MEDDGFSSIFDAVINRPPRLDCKFLKKSEIYVEVMLYFIYNDSIIGDVGDLILATRFFMNIDSA